MTQRNFKQNVSKLDEYLEMFISFQQKTAIVSCFRAICTENPEKYFHVPFLELCR